MLYNLEGMKESEKLFWEMKDRELVRVNVRIPRYLKKQILTETVNENTNMTHVIIKALERYFDDV